MKKTRIIIAALIVIAAVTIGFAAFAKGRDGNFYGPPGRNGIFRAGNLTPEQQQKLLGIRQKYVKDTIDLRYALAKKRIELKQLWSAKPLNQKAIETKEKEIAGLRVQITNKRRDMQEELKKILPETTNLKKPAEGQGLNKKKILMRKKQPGRVPAGGPKMFADSGRFRGKRGFGGGMIGMRGLDLSPQQQLKMLDIRYNFEKSTMNPRFEIQKKNLELKLLWAAKPLDQKAIEAKTKEIAGLRVQITAKAETMKEQMKKVLTREQLEKLEAGRQKPAEGIKKPDGNKSV